jgi:hypothetical protein
MSSVAELPSLSRPSTTQELGIPLSPPLDVGEQFRRALPEEFKMILGGLRTLVETTIYVKLLVEDEQQQRLAVAGAYPTFRNYYAGMAFAVAANLQHDREHFAQLLRGSFAEATALLRERGSRQLAPDALAVALHGLHTIARVQAALRHLAARHQDPPPDVVRDMVDNWIAYMMCFGALAYAIETNNPGVPRESAERLAFWSRGYAVAAFSVLAPLLPDPPRPRGSVPMDVAFAPEDEALLLTAEHDLARRLDHDNVGPPDG